MADVLQSHTRRPRPLLLVQPLAPNLTRSPIPKMTVGAGMVHPHQPHRNLTHRRPSDVDLERRTIRINKAWKRDGDNDGCAGEV